MELSIPDGFPWFKVSPIYAHLFIRSRSSVFHTASMGGITASVNSNKAVERKCCWWTQSCTYWQFRFHLDLNAMFSENKNYWSNKSWKKKPQVLPDVILHNYDSVQISCYRKQLTKINGLRATFLILKGIFWFCKYSGIS